MMLFPTLTTAIRRDFAGMIFRYGPAAVALVYPLALAALHLSGQHFVRATATTNRLQAGFAIFLAAALICAVPLISFTSYRGPIGPMSVIWRILPSLHRRSSR